MKSHNLRLLSRKSRVIGATTLKDVNYGELEQGGTWGKGHQLYYYDDLNTRCQGSK